MANTIDLDKLTTAFTALHETEAGRNGMVQFRVAMDTFRDSLKKSNLNDGEFLYMLRSIVDGMTVTDYSKSRELLKSGSKGGSKGGELSDEQLEQVAGGVVAHTQTVYSAKIQQLGQMTKFNDLGVTLKGAT